MTTRDPKAAARRRRAKQRAKGLHDLKMIATGAIVGAFALAMILMSTGQFAKPEPVYVGVPQQTTAVVQKANVTPIETPEDVNGYDCRTMGNHLCGPGNSNNVEPGYYKGKKLTIRWNDYVRAIVTADNAYNPQPVFPETKDHKF